MARVKLNEPLDMTLGDGTFWPWIFHAEITSHDNTTLTYSLSSPGGLRSMTLMGKGFTYSPGGEITGGAVHQVIWMDGAEQAASITNANVDMVRLMTDVAMEDWRAVASDFFSGKDVIKGSSGNDMLSGFDGPDTISAGLGADTLLGGTGPDIL
ncbi:MAG: hypothetical protein ACXWVO_11905, partial [Caulobacteraceae bacterium]